MIKRKLNRSEDAAGEFPPLSRHDLKPFANWYNGVHLHSAIRFVTPDARHAGLDRATLASRAVLYANARAQNPERWSGKTRNWQPAGPVWLSPERETTGVDFRITGQRP